jgi:hypothetical protein
MRLTTLAVATALVLATASVATAAATFENHGGRGNQFVHAAIGPGPVHRRHHQTFVLPYGYYDYDYPADDAFGEPPTDSPPLVSSVPPAPSPPPCQSSVEKFTVPSQDGGTKEITIINCP